MAGRRYALPLDRVEEVLLRVLITPIPGATDPVLGAIDYRGEVIGVVDLQARFGLIARRPARDDHFIVARVAGGRKVALWVDRATEARHIAGLELYPVPAEGTHAWGIARSSTGLVIIEDLDRLLSTEEALLLDRLMEVPADANSGGPA